MQNKDGSINAAKPFKPFGDFPSQNDSLIIGSKEMFQKPLTALQINFDWKPVDSSLAQAAADNSKFKLSNILTANNDVSQAAVLQTASDASVSNTVSSSSIQPKLALSSTVDDAVSSASFSNNIAQLSSSDFLGTLVNAGFFNSTSVTATVPANLLALYAGNWSSSPLASNIDLLSSPVSVSGSLSVNIEVTDADFGANENYAVNSVSGFIKLQLATDDYSFATYLSNTQASLTKTNVTVNSSGGTVTGYTVDPPKLGLPAPQLIANSISITYTAKTNIDLTDDSQASFNNSTAFYYHVEPFGSREMHPFLTNDAMSFLPVFNLDNNPTSSDSGELWIGLADAFAQETITVLFEVSEGSSNPLKSMTTIRWYYLSDNNWLPFDKLSIVDETNNLTRSGIVTVSLSSTVTTGNTRADASLIWIKLVADKDTDAVCKLIDVKTNAAKAQFAQNLSAGIEYTEPLPANTISKPVSAIAAIKQTQQPYPSFDGSLRETDDRFYVRVSERLRHKHRAVTTWDYERLVLDYFSQIHKAKCIPHTGFITNQNTGKMEYSEVAPGNVMLVSVPDLTNLSSANLLRPYTSVGLIEEIQQYLQNADFTFCKPGCYQPAV